MFAYVEQSGAMARAEAPNATSLAEIAKRLILLRKSLGYTQAFMANLIGASPQAWGNYEQGLRRIRIDEALLLCGATGVTLEWIYRGNIGLLPNDLLGKIQLELRDRARARGKRA